VTSHRVALTGLLPGTIYHYQVISVDTAGNVAALQDQTFTTTP
jgi:chitodextrinase